MIPPALSVDYPHRDLIELLAVPIHLERVFLQIESTVFIVRCFIGYIPGFLTRI